MSLLFSRLKKIIFKRMEQKLAPTLSYHGVFHTRDDVLPAVNFLAEEIGIGDEDLLLLNTAALLHDVGYLLRYEQNEPLAAEFARDVLPKFGYTRGQILIIAEIIMKTIMPQQPESLLEQIMCDADLDSLGRADFWFLSQKLRDELCAHGHSIASEDWLYRQRDFLLGHQYFTSAARIRGDKGKKNNLRQLEIMIQGLES